MIAAITVTFHASLKLALLHLAAYPPLATKSLPRHRHPVAIPS